MTDPTDPIPLITAADPAAGSGDVVADNIAALKLLFPAVMTDGKIDFDVLRQLLGGEVEDGEERYGLTWKGKRKARAFALTPTLATLRPAKAESLDWDSTKNIFIEGDNLEVLKCLRRSYSGKVKLIYIDPPYNTGNDFVYPDDYTESLQNYERLTGQRDREGALTTTNKESSGRFHTNWLNMMYPRLVLAKELLRSDGIIGVYIDDAELTNLGALMSEIFGESNIAGRLVYERNRKNDAKYFSIGHEYLVLYFRDEAYLSSNGTKFRGLKDGVDELKVRFDALVAEHGNNWGAVQKGILAFYEGIKSGDLREPLTRFRKVDELGPYRDDGNINWPGGGGPRYEVLHPFTKRPVKLPTSGWRYPNIDRFWEEYKKGRIVFGPDETTVPSIRTNIFENPQQVMTSVHFSYAQTSTNELTELFEGARAFDNPKSVSDAAKLAAYVTEDVDIIVDFFAGSGTTGHATLQQNVSDGRKRRYILVQFPEQLDPEKNSQKAAATVCDTLGIPRTIAELTKERLRRAGAKLRADHPDVEFDAGFRVYKLATSNLKPWQPETENLEASLLDAINNILPGRTEDDLLVELLLKTGIDLTLPSEVRSIADVTVHALGGGVLMVCLADIAETQAEALGQGICDWRAELDPPRATTFYFKDSGFANAATIRQRVGAAVEKLASI